MTDAPPKQTPRPVPASPTSSGLEGEAAPSAQNESNQTPPVIKVEKVRQLGEIKAGDEVVSFMESFKGLASVPSTETSSTAPVAAVDAAGAQSMASMPVSGETFDALGAALVPPPLEMYGPGVSQLRKEVPTTDAATAQLNIAIEVARKYDTSAKLTTALEASGITTSQLTEEAKVVLSEVTQQWTSEGKPVPKEGDTNYEDFNHAVNALAYARELAKRKVGEDGKVLSLAGVTTDSSTAASPVTMDARDTGIPVTEEEIAGESVKEQLSAAKDEVKKWFGKDAKKAKKALEATSDAARKAQVARIDDSEIPERIQAYEALQARGEATPGDLLTLSALVQEQNDRNKLTGTPEQIKVQKDARVKEADDALNTVVNEISVDSPKLAMFLQLLRKPQLRDRMEQMYVEAQYEIQENRGDAVNIILEIVKLLLWDMGSTAVTEITGVGKGR